MKTKLALLCAALLLTAGTARADLTGEACATVLAIVNPNIAVGVNTPIVDAGTVQTGDFTATISFRVDANVQAVELYVCASALYKGDDPTNMDVAPIPLNLSEGVLIDPVNANPLGGRSQVAAFTGTGTIMDYPAQCTEVIAYESSQNNHFSQNVVVVVTWNQDDPEKPTGQYSGKVCLYATVLPGEPPVIP